MGRADTPRMSRTTPPTPVLAPPKGSSAEGWLWVSTLTARSSRSSKARIPALSTNTDLSQGASRSSVARRRAFSRPSWSETSTVPSARGVGQADPGLEGLVRAVLGPGLGQSPPTRRRWGRGPARRNGPRWPASRPRPGTAAAACSDRPDPRRPGRPAARSVPEGAAAGHRREGPREACRGRSSRWWRWPAAAGPAARCRRRRGRRTARSGAPWPALSGARPSVAAARSSSLASGSVTPRDRSHLHHRARVRRLADEGLVGDGGPPADRGTVRPCRRRSGVPRGGTPSTGGSRADPDTPSSGGGGHDALLVGMPGRPYLDAGHAADRCVSPWRPPIPPRPAPR